MLESEKKPLALYTTALYTAVIGAVLKAAPLIDTSKKARSVTANSCQMAAPKYTEPVVTPASENEPDTRL